MNKCLQFGSGRTGKLWWEIGRKETEQNLSAIPGSLRTYVSVCQDHETLGQLQTKMQTEDSLWLYRYSETLFYRESFAITSEACELLKPMQFGRFSDSKHLMNIDIKYLLASLRTLVSLKMF